MTIIKSTTATVLFALFLSAIPCLLSADGGSCVVKGEITEPVPLSAQWSNAMDVNGAVVTVAHSEVGELYTFDTRIVTFACSEGIQFDSRKRGHLIILR